MLQVVHLTITANSNKRKGKTVIRLIIKSPRLILVLLPLTLVPWMANLTINSAVQMGTVRKIALNSRNG